MSSKPISIVLLVSFDTQVKKIFLGKNMKNLFKMILTISLSVLVSQCNEDKRTSNGGGGAGGSGGGNEDPNGGPIDTEIKTGEITSFETNGAGELFDLVFSSSSATFDTNISSGNPTPGRHLSEYLLIVRATQDSCVQLEVSPDPFDPGSDTVIDDESDVSTCDNPEPQDNSSNDDELDDEGQIEGGGDSSLNFGLMSFKEKVKPTENSFNLTSDTLCSERPFRTQVGEIIHQKTARLAIKHPISINGATKTIRVWVDLEMAGITCNANGMVDRNPIGFGPLWSPGSPFNNYQDQFTFRHVQNLADNAGKAYKILAEAYGDVSDVDGNNGIDIFVSPDINREYFESQNGNQPNSFHTRRIHKSEDLAAFNPTNNPVSNEAEVVYMWAPDPGSIYNPNSYPSSHSLNTNYARGFMAYQIMNQIIANKKLIQQSNGPESEWLRDSLSLLAANLAGGNDYTFRFTADYLSSQSHYVSLTNETAPNAPAPILNYVGSEQVGMKTLFGWYVHSRLCGQVLTPCAKMNDLLDDSLRGISSLEAVFGEEFPEILENFGVSVGVALVDNPEKSKAFWTGTLPSGTPAGPISFPKAGKLSSSHDSTLLDFQPLGGVDSGSKSVSLPVILGALTSRNSELFQPIFPDYTLDLKLSKNGVAYVILSNAIAQETLVKSYFGPGLKVVVVPLGERETSNVKSAASIRRTRIVHNEKFATGSGIDLRPVNLTNSTSSDTFRNDIFGYTINLTPDPSLDFLIDDFIYSRGLDYQTPFYNDTGVSMALSEDKEIWVAGEISNYDVDVGGSPTQAGDTDSFVLEITPCPTGDPVCTSKGSHEVFIQLSGKFDEENTLDPMFLATENNQGMFRGGQAIGKVVDFSVDFEEPEGVTSLLCIDGSSYNDLPPESFGHCANGEFFDVAEFNSNGNQQYYYDYKNYSENDPGYVNFDIVQSSFPSTFDNFLQSGPMGFPFTNAWSLAQEDSLDTIRNNRSEFISEEFNRMFLNFGYNGGLEPISYNYHAVTPANGIESLNQVLSNPDTFSALPEEEITLIRLIRSVLAQPGPIDNDPETNLVFEEFFGACQTYAVPQEALCEDPDAHRATLSNAVNAYLNGGNVDLITYFIECSTIGCEGNINTDINANVVSANLRLFSRTFAGSKNSFYKPIEIVGSGGGCKGSQLSPSSVANFCTFKSSSSINSSDIRQQLNLFTEEFASFCAGESTSCSLGDVVPGGTTQYKVMGDRFSFLYGTGSVPGGSALFSDVSQRVESEGEFTRPDGTPDENYLLFPVPRRHSTRFGEIADKSNIMHHLMFKVDSSSTTKVNIVVGGRNKTEGKYLLRGRVTNLNTIEPFSDLY